MTEQLAAVVVNDQGTILPYTVQATKERCAEHAKELFGEGAREKVKTLGGHVAQCKIVLLDCPKGRV